MRARDPRLWLGLTSLVLVLGMFAMDYEQTSPGPLSPSHAALEELQGSRSCAGCHGGWLETMTGSCLGCHEEIERQLADGVGLHGAGIAAARGDEAARTCATCHVEHHGDQLPLAGAEAFALTGIPDREAFDHGHVAFALAGRHTELACTSCHPLADEPILAEGQARFLGLVQACTACHDDPHEGRFARGCQDCHGQEKPFGELESFTHGDAFPLVGAHARQACLDCHPKGGEHEVEDLAGRAPPPPARTCQDCHDSPHRQAFTARAGHLLELVPGDSCGACHDAEGGPFANPSAELSPELHASTGFALDRPHDQARCVDCHAGDGGQPPARVLAEPLPAGASAVFAARFPGRSADDCAACHDDPHGGQFDVEPYSDSGCLACHERAAFAPPAFGVEEHARCEFPLAGDHTAVACNACHLDPTASEGEPRIFRGTARACSACHDDAHAFVATGEFAAPAARREELGGCGACHVPERFAQVDRDGFDHGGWTGFELGGAHGRATCESCHPPAAPAQAAGRTFGRVDEHFPGSAQRCETCHADPHRGSLASPEGCARCHSTEGFRTGDAIAGFDHGGWTGFALEGAHLRAECASCHGDPPPPAGKPLAAARSFGFVVDRIGRTADTCSACHEDPHEGRFDDEVGRSSGASCERCHTSESFAEIDHAAFDHARWTGFALAGEHARVACEDCHATSTRPLEGTVGLGPVRGTECAACHVDPHVGQFARAGRTDCEACHSSERGFHALEFDHRRDSRFPLDERHARLDCAACHVPWPLSNGQEAVRYKPLGTECVDCHDPSGRGGRRAATGSARGGGGGVR